MSENETTSFSQQQTLSQSMAKYQTLDVSQAYEHCLKLAEQHYENFPTASKVLRRELRPAVAAIYAFAREADDMADEGNDPSAIRLKKLDAWAVLLDRCVNEEVKHPVFLALRDTIHRYSLPVDYFHDLLTAFRMDCEIQHYTHESELMFYSKHSANPVGRLVLALHGINSPQACRASDAICTGLQLANFWQDLSVDLPRGRCYIPTQWFEGLGFTRDDLLQRNVSTEQFQPVKENLVSFTSDLFLQGTELLPLLPFRLRLQIAATLHGGLAILQAFNDEADPFHHRPVLDKSNWKQLIPSIISSTLLPRSAMRKHPVFVHQAQQKASLS